MEWKSGQQKSENIYFVPNVFHVMHHLQSQIAYITNPALHLVQKI